MTNKEALETGLSQMQHTPAWVNPPPARKTHPGFRSFNINQKVRIKLTARGHQILEESFQNLCAKVPNVEFFKPKEDADGWSEWQMWEVMADFGAYISMGTLPPFETEIQIPN